MKKVLDTIIDILTFVVLIVSLVVMALSLTQSEEGLPNLFGKTILTVQSDSMEPTFKQGDLLFCTVGSPEDEYEKGDVVTYAMVVNGYYVLNTHRIDEVVVSGTQKVYITKGDNEKYQDTAQLQSKDILAVWHEKKIDGLGYAVDYLQTKTGFFACVLLPMIVLFIYELFRFIKNTIDYNKENAEVAAKKAMNEFTEEQKQKAIQEYLESQKKNQE